jgi:hypothetical protein
MAGGGYRKFAARDELGSPVVHRGANGGMVGGRLPYADDEEDAYGGGGYG